ncbi:hypothetical protein B0H13DRAFT_2145308 [Mycena leptocephala]|nr:hypothetical protein B0H13DRAFT_2145308 [Mycena leptocephala]
MRVLSLSSLLAAVAAPLGCAFTIAVPTNPTSGEVTEINWTFTAKDPATFSLFLTNSTNAFDLKRSLARTSRQTRQIHTLLPTLPALGGYALHAVNAENVDFILAASPPFAITS